MQNIEPMGKPPKAIFLMGGAGSGKGAIRGHIVEDHPQRNYLIIDPDLIKEKLPKYKEAVAKGTSSREAHEESMKKAISDLKEAVKNKVNFIFDSTGSNSFLYKNQMMEALKQGMEVKLIYVETDVEICVKRVKSREEQTKRVVPEDVVRSSNLMAQINFEELQNLANTWKKYNNDAVQPVLIKKVKIDLGVEFTEASVA